MTTRRKKTSLFIDLFIFNVLRKRVFGQPYQHLAFHGTKREFLADIIEKGLDPKLAKPGFFGKGVYFATTPSLAHKFTTQTCYEPEEEGHSEENCLKCSRFLLVCNILLGQPEKRIHKVKFLKEILKIIIDEIFRTRRKML